MNLLKFLFDPIYFMLTNKNLLESQIDVFLEWGRRNHVASLSYREWLDLFRKTTSKTDILDANMDDVDFFLQKVHNEYASKLSYINARKSVMALMRFYMARSKNGKARLVGGRPPHISGIEQAQKYRKMGLTIREISKLMDRHLSHIHRWVKYPLNKE